MLIKSLRTNSRAKTNSRYLPPISSATGLDEPDSPSNIKKYLMRGITFASRQPKDKYKNPMTASHEIGWHLGMNEVYLKGE